MPRPGNTEKRRSQIVDGLRKIFSVSGFDGATTGAIAREAGLAPGLVHYHFSSKQEVLLAMVEDLAARSRARLAARLERSHSPRGRLGAALDALLAGGPDADPLAAACWTLVTAEAIRQPEVRALHSRWLAEVTTRLADLLAEACRAEGRSPAGVPAMATGLATLVTGALALSAAAPEAVPPGSAALAARRTAFALLDSQPLAEA